MPKQEYGADSLTVLEGLDAVRKRPGMYIGTTDSQGLMHCLWEIIDNAVDEALAGACDHITVTLHDDGSVEVADNGRGIPVDVEPKTKLTGVEVVLTKLHAGAKFGNASYNAAGGLHGVGSSVVNALSSRLDVEVDRDGKTHHMAFHQGHPGVYSDTDPEHPSPDAPFKRTRKNRPTELEIIGKVSPKTTGTRIRYWADPEIFNDTAEFSYEQLIDRVRQTSFLVPGLRITVIDENVPETGDDSVDEMMEVDAAQTPADDGTGLMDAADIASAADTAVEDTVEAGEAEARSAAVSAAVETAKVDAARHTHARVEEFRHTGGVKDFVDFLSAGEAVSDIWRITGEDTYEEETQAVGEGGELHAQKVTRKCGVDIAMRWTNVDYLDEYRKSTGSAENMRSQIQDYIADAARAKLAEDKALAENAVLRREAAALREQLAKERQRETRREERAARAAAETEREQPAPEAPAADSAQADETN